MTSVTRQTCETYVIQHEGEYARIGIVEWAPRKDHGGRTLYGGEILVHSSFGAFCNSWGACGEPFKRFLIGLDRDYFMTKCRGLDAERFDGEKSVRALREVILQERRTTSIDRDEARAWWDGLNDRSLELEEDERGFVEGVLELRLQISTDLFDEPWHWCQRSLTPNCIGFWRDTWPHFVQAVRAETVAVAA